MATDKTYVTYSSIANKEVSKIFFERFLGTIKKHMTNFFGEVETTRVLRQLGTGQLRIKSPENFLYSSFDINDKSINIYNEATSVDDFFYKSLIYFKGRAETGETDIEIREFFFALIDLISANSTITLNNDINKYIKMFVTTLVNVNHKSPFVLKIVEPHLKWLVEETYGLNMKRYGTFINALYLAYRELTQKRNQILGADLYFPRIEFLYPVYHDVRGNQLQYLMAVFGVEKTHVKAAFKNIDDLADYTPEFEVVFDKLEAETGKKLNRETVMLELRRIKRESPFKTYPTMKDYTTSLNSLGIPRQFFADRRVKRICTNQELFEKCLRPYFCDIEINCDKLQQRGIEAYIDGAKTLSLFKNYFFDYHKKEEAKKRTPYHKITLTNVRYLTQEFIDFLNKKAKQLKSSTGKEFFFEVQYHYDVSNKKFGRETRDPYVRIISDIHADYNKQHNYSFNFGDDFVINCGDTGGDSKTCLSWIRNNMRKGVVVAGNHLGYSPTYPELERNHTSNTRNSQLHEFRSLQGGSEDVIFLSNSVTKYEGLVILGTTLFTDFALYGDKYIEEAMQYAKNYMNDFKLITVTGHRDYTRRPDGNWDIKMKKKEDIKVRNFTPQDHAYYFHYCMNFLKEQLLKYSDRTIVVVTHHAPSPYCISPEYTGSMLNPAFASNLNEFILKNPQIRLWCHGHVHNYSDFILGNTRVVCCPFGYNNENDAVLPYNYGIRIRVADIKSKEPWTKLCSEEIQWGLTKVYES